MVDIESIKASILKYIEHFTMYDYFAYSWLILIFFVLILLCIVLAKKSPIVSVLLLMISLTSLLVGPFVIKHYLDLYLRPTKVLSKDAKALHFSDALVVSGEIKNISNNIYTTCDISIKVLKNSENKYKKLLYSLKPLRKQTISLNEQIDINSTAEFRAVFYEYTLGDFIDVSVTPECY